MSRCQSIIFSKRDIDNFYSIRSIRIKGLTLLLRFLVALGFANGQSLIVDPKTGLIFSPVDALLVQNYMNLTITIETSSEIDLMDGDIDKFIKHCVRNRTFVDIPSQLKEFSKNELIKRIEGELKRYQIPYGTVSSENSSRRTVESVESKYNFKSISKTPEKQLQDDPKAITQVITESNYDVEFDADDIFNEFELCFGRDLMSPKLDLQPETRKRMSHGENPTTIYQTGYLIKEESNGKHMNINIGKCGKETSYPRLMINPI